MDEKIRAFLVKDFAADETAFFAWCNCKVNCGFVSFDEVVELFNHLEDYTHA